MEKRIGLIVIMNVHTRKSEGLYLKRVIESSIDPDIKVIISYDNGSLGLWGNYKQALTIGENKYSHRIVVHDDIVFDRNIIQSINLPLKYLPKNAILSLYNPTNNAYIDAYNKGHRILKTQTNFWVQASIYEDEEMDSFLHWCNEHISEDYEWEDRRLASYLKSTNQYVYAIVPGVVQHLGAFRSNFNIGGKVGKRLRYSKTVDSSQNMDIDWEKHFKNPYKTETGYNAISDITKRGFFKIIKK